MFDSYGISKTQKGQHTKQNKRVGEARKCGKIPPMPSPKKKTPVVISASPKSKRTEATKSTKVKK